MTKITAALIILLVGLITIMIEVNARISSLNIYLLGFHITFSNQVLFFQSKSIVDMVTILIKTGRIDSMIVGILLLCFSILFPIFKLTSASIYLIDKPWAKNKFIHYFAFKSGKWSMADVMVVGIMMTYIGFNGILESQLAVLNIHNESLVSITTNNTSLQPGYIIFVGLLCLINSFADTKKYYRLNRNKEICLNGIIVSKEILPRFLNHFIVA